MTKTKRIKLRWYTFLFRYNSFVAGFLLRCSDFFTRHSKFYVNRMREVNQKARGCYEG